MKKEKYVRAELVWVVFEKSVKIVEDANGRFLILKQPKK